MKAKFKIGDIVKQSTQQMLNAKRICERDDEVYEPIFRQIVNVFPDDTYEFKYTDSEDTFLSKNSSDPELYHWDLKTI